MGLRSRLEGTCVAPRLGRSGGVRAFALGALPPLVFAVVVLVFGLARAEAVPVATGPASAENLAARARALRERLPERFEIRVAEPFVLIAETSAEEAERSAAIVVEVVAQARRAFGARDPEHAIDVWLFADTASYRDGVRSWLGTWPRTLSGFYSPARRSVAVNLASGEAALRHEIVHPLLEATFPGLPAWVDEGVAALFERVRETPEGLEALPDRHLPRLQQALRRRKLPSLGALTIGTDREFYADPQRTSYAQARSIMMFLHGEGLLERYLRRLAAPDSADPTGLAQLVEVANAKNTAALQKRWEAFVVGLQAP